MKRFLLLGVFMGLGVAVVFLCGCDEDKDRTGSHGTVDPADSAFLTDFFTEDGLMADPGEIAEVSFALLEHEFGSSAPKTTASVKALQQGDEIIIINGAVYSFSDGWHIFDFEATIINQRNNDTVDVVGTDSVQLLENGLPVEIPNESTEMDGLKARAHADWDLRPHGSNHGDIHRAVDIILEVVGADTIIEIDGSAHDTLLLYGDWNNGTCNIDVTLDQTITDLRVYAEGPQDCPISGYVSIITSLDVLYVGAGEDPDTLSISGNWHVTATVNDDSSITFTFSNGTVSWTVTQPCDSQLPAAPWGRVTAISRNLD